jgi:ATP-dependent 26S proteasome regulatory subunit
VAGIARHSGRLLASGQHLKRGVLLYGAPGTGKTHTVRYLLSRLPEVTVIAISGKALGRIAEACSVARTLQPAVIVAEDVDLAAELPLPDADARRALLRLHQGNLVLDGVDLDPVIERTDGVTAPFLRELLRKAALLAAEEDEAGPAGEAPGTGGKDDAPIRVTGAQLTAALDQLLGTRGQLTRVLLGGQRG